MFPTNAAVALEVVVLEEIPEQVNIEVPEKLIKEYKDLNEKVDQKIHKRRKKNALKTKK